MLFRSATALLSVLALAQSVPAALTPDQVVTNIVMVTTISNNLNTQLTSLSPVPTPQQAQSVANTLTSGFQTIITDLAADVTAMNETPPFDDVDATPVVNTLVDFIQVHQALLGTVIGKHAIFAQFGLTAPIAAVLRSLEAGVDTFAFSMVALIPTKAPTVQSGASSLDNTVQSSINTYQQTCIPSPLYPSVQPVCIAL